MSTSPTSSSPAIGGFAVTPHDTTLFAQTCRSLWVGTGGSVSVLMADGTTVDLKNVADGSLLPVSCRRVNATGTDASDIRALY